MHEYAARLALATYRSSASVQGELELDMLLCLDQLQPRWQEMEVRARFPVYV